MIRFSLLLIFILHDHLSIAQELSLRIGDWASHLPYQAGSGVTQSSEAVYYSTEWSILKIDKQDFSSERISKTDGLSDVGISTIAYDNYHDQLVIVYNNSNIDIVRNDGVVNLPNILTNTDLSGSKKINAITITPTHIYFGADFGLVQLDGNSLLFGSTTFIPVSVNDVAATEREVFIATDDGIYFINLSGGANLIDFSLWELLGQGQGLPSVYTSNSIVHFKDKFYAEVDNDLYYISQSTTDNLFTPESNSSISFLSPDGQQLMVGVTDDQGSGKVIFINGFTESGSGCTDRIKDAVQDQNGRVWYADEFGGFRTAEDNTAPCQRLSFDSPYSHQVSDISVKDNQVFVSSGGVKENFDYNSTRNGYYILKDQRWKNFNQDQIDFIKENDLLNFLTILPDTDEDKVYVGTYWGGLLEHNLETGEMSVYNDSNSALLGTSGDEQRERVTSMSFDTEQNLWVSTFGSPRPLAVFTSSGEWENFSLLSNKNLTHLEIDDFGFLWVPAFGNNGGCYVFDPGENPLSSGDDRIRFFNASNSELTTNTVNTAKTDMHGNVWVGTSEGPVIFDCGSDPFSNDCRGKRIKVEQDSIGAFLLADQDILVIEIDGANQKWIGTRNGIFVQSPDGEEQIHRFNIDNSPLFDNRIRDIAYDGNHGIVYIGSDKGLQSYRSEYTSGESFQSTSNVRVFPNPVEPHYTGPIAIKGLIQDAFVQITDIGGNLVAEIRASGGQAIWDGRDLKNSIVKTGVYLVFSTEDKSFDVPDSFVTKVMIIR